MQRKDLALRVLSTAAIMSIVTSIAAPAFADVYYIGNGSIDVETITSTDGKQYVKVTQGDKTYTDTSDEIVIKDGTDEDHTTLREDTRIKEKRAEVAVPDKERTDTQEQEAAGSADAAGESQPDPDAAFTLSEAEEDSAQTQEGKDTTEEKKEPAEDSPKEDVVYEYAPAADPDSEQQATKLAPTTSADPTAKTKEATLDAAPAADPAPTTPAEGSAEKPTKNVIRVINNWVGEAAKELKIRLSNVNIKVEKKVNKAAMDVSGDGKTKVELDGQNVLDSYGTDYPASYQAGLRKQGEGTLIITDETNDEGKKITTPKLESDTSGSLTAKGAGGNGAAGIGGSAAEGTKNITIEGYATVHATGSGNGAGIGGGGYYGKEKPGDAENIIIQGYATVDATGDGGGAGIGGGFAGNAKNIIIRGHSKVKATARDGAAIGGGSAGWGSYYGGSAKGIVICDHATVAARSDTGDGAAIGAAAGDNGKDTEAEVTIGTAGATAEQEDVHVTATGFCGSAIGNGAKDTKVTIQGHSTIWTANIRNSTAIGSKDGNVEVNIKDNVTIDTDNVYANAEPDNSGSGIGGGDIRGDSNRKVVVNIDGGTNGKVKIGDYVQIFGKYGAISATEVNIGNNVLLKMKPWKSLDDKYINVKGAEAKVGKRSDPKAGGLVNTIGDNTELWYSAYGRLQKIVHGKNVCTKKEIGRKDATCTEDGWVKYGCTYESDRYATAPEHIDEWTETIPATGHHWKDNGNGTHTCTNCGATEALPSDTNSALELRVVDAEGMNEPFTVSENGTLRTYTGAYDTATLTGDLNTLRYLQEHGAQTIQFVTNGKTSSFAINDLLAQGSGSEVFYLTHRGAEEPTLLLVEADHSELVKD
ncbi:hypothetical protein [Faecalibacterium sp. Marseille-P9312]|uniref:hypothetical protein n=1 Tax=Faecalibacterium sp. Marseille-P9312 TaxID=2580425 RepID=UPI00122CCC11|nr:hypothetical protein [Faecalibacterium sp. Marseille-P9312]